MKAWQVGYYHQMGICLEIFPSSQNLETDILLISSNYLVVVVINLCELQLVDISKLQIHYCFVEVWSN